MSPQLQIKDLAYIIDTYGYPREICGHACDRTALVDMLLKRTLRVNAIAAIIQTLLDHGTVNGPLPDDDKHLATIYRRWALEGLVDLSPTQRMQVDNLKYPFRHQRKAKA